MTDIELTEEEQMILAVAYGTLFSLSLVTDYFDGIEPIMISRRANYALNKNKEAQRACISLKEVIQR